MSLPEPIFITRDVAAITAEMIAEYEALTGKTLQPAQPEMLLINLIAYRESLCRIGIQEAAKQNLVNYAAAPMLDYLGELVGSSRLPEQPALCTISFTLVGLQVADVIVPPGTRVATKDNLYIFATDAALAIPAGQPSAAVAATCETTGIAANGYQIGDINITMSPIALVASAASTTITTGGSNAEPDDHYRERIKLAPEAFSNAGAKGAYIYWAKTAHQDIVDVAVTSPSPGVVNVYPLMSAGTPSAEILTVVETALNQEKVRPLTDQVVVLAPTRVGFVITTAVTLYTWADTDSALSQINAALAAYTANLRAKMGVDVVVDQIKSVITTVSGVYKPGLTAPNVDIVIAANEWADCTAITITVAGYTNG